MALARKTRNTTSDPHNIERRLELIIHQHLADMEEHPDFYAAKDRLATIQYVSAYLNRKYGWGEDESSGAGSAVRKYSGAFRITKSGSAEKPTRVRGGSYVPEADEEDAA